MNDRRLMSEATPKKATKEGSPLLSEPRKGFNLLEWAQGVRPIKRAVPLYQRLDLLAERDILGAELKDAQLAGDADAVTDLSMRIRALTDEIKGTSVTVILTGVTASRYSEIIDEGKARTDVVTAEDLVAYQIAAQIVEPEGFDYETLKVLDDLMPVQMAKIGTAWTQINQTTPDVEATIPF